MKAEDIFLAALERKSPAERLAFLDGACGDDPFLRAQVVGLLHSHEEAGSFLDAPLFDSPPTIDQTGPERLGTQIGPYKLLQKIGEGGFGVVYMAEQQEPVRRRVALKVIKPGMDTRQVIARFEAERQALAMMDHANIARVMDAGATASGRPYFVMELVRGVPITAYCDQNHLPVRERLELFAAVCHAIQHAHQKGIIHRDIKPSNVLVTSQDGQAVVKVIDFGVAKAMGQQLTDKTLFTDFAQMIGTPLYMSPEQAELSSADIDTRSDIFSLGVMLYELLTGSTPVDKEQMKQAAFDEIRRLIREEEPQKPSTRISSAEAAPSIAAQRHTEPAKLARLVRGELDWIVMKALEKDRNRRYETASAFAKDLEHFLHDEPVLACPPSAVYRLRKFARRNKALLATVATIAAALVIGIAVSTWQAIRATKAENLAQSRLVSANQATARATAAGKEAFRQKKQAETNAAETEVQRKEAEAQRNVAEKNFVKARTSVDDYFVKVSESQLLKGPGLQPLRRELLEAALKFYEELAQQRSKDPALQKELAGAHYRVGRVRTELGAREAALQAYAKAQELYEGLLKAEPGNIDLEHGRARCQFWRGQSSEAIAAWEKLIERDRSRTDIRRELASAYNSIANSEKNAGKPAESLQWHKKAHEIRKELAEATPDNIDDRYALGQTLNNIAVLLSGNDADALALYRRALEHGQFAYNRAPQNVNYGRLVGTAQGNIGICESRLGSKEPALKSFQLAIDVWKKLALDNPAVPDLHANLLANYRRLADYQRDLGQSEKWTGTIRLAQQVLERFPQQSASDLYSLACLHAVTAALSAKDPLTATAAELVESQAVVDRESNEAVDALDRAIRAGFSDLVLLQIDKDLDPLRQREDFKMVLAKLDETLKSKLVAQAEQERGARYDALAKAAAQGATPEALAASKEKLAIDKGLAAEDPQRLDRQADVAATQHTIGLIQLSLEQLEEAGQSLAQAEATRQFLVTKEPSKLSYQADLAATRLALGTLDWKTNRLADGAARWQQGLTQLEEVVHAEPENNRFVSQLAAAHAAVGNSYGEIGLWKEAAGHYAKAFAAQPSGNSYAWLTVGYLSFYVGDRESYDRVCREALERSKGNIDRRLLSDLTACINLSPKPLIESAKLVEMAQQVLAVEPTAGWRRFRVSLAQYRAEQFAEALHTLEGYSGFSETWPLKAMIYHRLGQPEQARPELAKIDRHFDKTFGNALAAESLKLPGWNGLVMVQVLRREAHELIDGRPYQPGALEHLVRGRAYAKLGQQAKADAEFQAAAADTAAADPAVLLARVQVFDQLGRTDEADAVLLRAAELMPGDSRPWIARARLFARRGERERAENLFAKAATIAPDELNRFLEAGWWASAEPAGDGPLGPAGPDAMRKWHQVPTAEIGRVDFPSVAEVKALPVVHAVNYVYSPDLRSVTLLVGSADRARVEVNGELVYEGAGRAWEWGLVKVPALLRPGRNTFVATVVKPDQWNSLVLRIADSRFDRGYLLANLGLWDEALALWTPELEAHPPQHPWTWYYYAAMLLAQGKMDDYRRICGQMLERPLPSGWDATRIPAASALVPVDEATAARLVDKLDQIGKTDAANDWIRVMRSLIFHRAKRHQQALDMLEDPESRPHWLRGNVYLLRALCQHALGNASQARSDLTKADRWGEGSFKAAAGVPHAPAFRNYNCVLERIDYVILSREAHQLIAGDTAPHERDLAELVTQVRGYLSASDQFRVAYDRAILLEPSQAGLWLGRYKARAAAGQGEQAEQELEQLVRAAPATPDGWKVRGGIYATLGRHDQAAADFAKALALTPGPDVWSGGSRRQLCAQIAQWPEVFDRVVKLLPDEQILWIGRAYWHSQHSRWKEAAADFAKLDDSELKYDETCAYAGLKLLQGRDREYREITRDFIDRIGSFDSNNEWVGLYLAKTCTLSASLPAEQSQVVAWAETGRTGEKKQGVDLFVLGLAYYRAGESERAIPVLEQAAKDWVYGRHPVEKQQMELVRAMCEFRLEQIEQARQRLKTACELIDQAVPYTPEEPFAIYPANWVSLNILRREAEGLILDKK